MDDKSTLEIEFPCDWDYIPAVRKFVAEAALIEGFNQKFSYRTEIIIDELCNNSVKFACPKKDSNISLQCRFTQDAVHVDIRDAGASEQEVENLRMAIENVDQQRFMGRGLEIVKMLASSIDVDTKANGETIVKVVKKRSMNLIDTIVE
jgi:anti-sigma regulatory factor (Ser/Thr protein kinase)